MIFGNNQLYDRYGTRGFATWDSTYYTNCSVFSPKTADRKFLGEWISLIEWKRRVRESAIWKEFPAVIKPLKAIRALLRRMQINQPCWRATRWKSLT